jgi:hypothetical protein
MRVTRVLICLAVVCCAAAPAAQLTAAAEEDFNKYIKEVETELAARVRGQKQFLWVEEAGTREVTLRREGVIVEPFANSGDLSIRNGLIHDWRGAAFIPNATATQVVKVVTDYANHSKTYSPEVVDSKILDHLGPKYHVFLRLKKKKVLTAVLNTEHRAEYRSVNAMRWYGISRSIRIQEVDNAGSADESTKPVGQDSGFLWKLNVYWRFEQVSGGTIAECRAVSLTRDVPTGLGWMIRPIVRSLPRESLENTLKATRDAVMDRAASDAAERAAPGTTL